MRVAGLPHPKALLPVSTLLSPKSKPGACEACFGNSGVTHVRRVLDTGHPGVLAGRQSLEVLDPAVPEAALTDAVMSANETLLTEGNLN